MSRAASLGLILVLILGIFGLGCGSSSETVPPDGDTTETPDGDMEEPGEESDVEEETEADGDAAEEEEEASGDQCTFYTDCAAAEDCREGKCLNAPICYGNSTCPADQICFKINMRDETGRCRVACATDNDCPAEGHCLNGVCEIYHPIAPGTPPEKHPEWNGKLHAGFASGPLEFPMTTTLGGYGARQGPLGPYQSAMGASAGVYDRPSVKVLTLDDGNDRAVFVRLPMIFATEFLVTGITGKVIELGGPDLRENLVVTATHSHAGPGRFWNLLPDLGFGSLGMSEFSWEIYSRLVESISKVVVAAQQDLRPARFGYAMNTNFDPEDKINRDRRGENDHYKDNRLIVWRIDDLSGAEPKPWVVTLNYATHGTTEDNVDSFITNDAPGGAENMTQLLYEQEFGTRIETLFFNGMAGDISQAGGDLGHEHTQQMIMIGHRVYAKVMELFDRLETATEKTVEGDFKVVPMSDTLDIRIISKRVPIDRANVGYLADDQFYNTNTGPYRFGAFQCGLLNTPQEENLDIYLTDAQGNVLKKSSKKVIPDKDDGEWVTFTPETAGTYYLHVEGFEGCMNDYQILVSANETKSNTRGCIDARCGLPCGACPAFKTMAPANCQEDSLEDNDDIAHATSLTVGTKVDSLQVCPFDADWFKVDLEAGKTYMAKIFFTQDTGAYNPDSRLHDGDLGCVLPVDSMNAGPIPDFSKTRFTHVLLGGLYLAGLPGESTSRMGADAEAELRASTSFEDIVVFGYTNDHHFYIEPEDDWLQGGYNTSMSIWGYKFGEFLINHLKRLAVAMSEGNEAEVANEFPKMKPINYNKINDDTRVPLSQAIPNTASILQQPTNTIRMSQQAVMRWIGCDPGVDFPHIFLERKTGEGAFEPVMRPGGRVYDDSFYEMKLEFENESFAYPNKPDADVNNYWTVTWEETFNFPAGIYRLRAEGNCYSGAADHFDKENGIDPYTLTSAEFELLPTHIDVQLAEVTGDAETGYTLSASLRYDRPVPVAGEDGLLQNNALLLHSDEVEPSAGPRCSENVDETVVVVKVMQGETEIGQPETIALTAEAGVVLVTINTLGEQTPLASSRPVTRLTAALPELAAGDYSVVIEVTDVWGNTGSKAIPLTVPAD